MPGDIVVGVYYPWLDYKWGFPAGVPVKNPITTDVPSFIYPMQTLAVDMWKNGDIPLWNRLILAGTPLLANFQSAPFSPTIFVYFLFDTKTAWSIQVILQHVLVAFFTYALLRSWNRSKTASILGGIAFAFAGYTTIWSQWNGHTLAAAFIPLLLLSADTFLKKGKALALIGVSISIAFLILSGYPQTLIYAGFAFILLYLLRICSHDQKQKVFRTLFLGIFAILGIGLAAIQIIPGAELLSLSQRRVEPHPYDWAFLPLSKTITFLAPDYFGNHATENYWGPQDYTSNTGFIGVGIAVLASVTVFLKKNREITFAFLLLVLSLLLAFPTPISIYIWKSGILGMNAASAHRSLVLFNLSAAILAAFGLDLLQEKKVKIFKIIFIPAVIIGIYTALALIIWRVTPGQSINGSLVYQVALKNLIFPYLVLFLSFLFLYLSKHQSLIASRIPLLFILLITFELFRFGWKFTPFSNRELIFPTTPALEFLQKQSKPMRVTGSHVIPINLRMPYNLESIEGYDAVYPLKIAKFIASLNGAITGNNPQGRYAMVDYDTSPVLDLLNTKYYLTLKQNDKGEPDQEGKIPDKFPKSRFFPVFADKTTVVMESKTALPRAFMVYNWQQMEDERALNTILQNNIKFSDELILAETPKIKSTIGKVEQKVEFQTYDYQKSILDVQTNKDGMLFISDAWFPGWKAFVDQQETKIYRADYAFMALEIPKGKHRVELSYLPNSWKSGLLISKVSLGTLILSFLLYHFLGKAKLKRYTLGS